VQIPQIEKRRKGKLKRISIILGAGYASLVSASTAITDLSGNRYFSAGLSDSAKFRKRTEFS
jgi:hypothetical protein